MEELDFLEEQAKFLNSQKGDLEYYNCNICNNKGIIYKVINNDIALKKCKCENLRNVFKNLKNCGVEKDLFNKYTLELFSCNAIWRKKFKERAIKFLEDDSNKWFCVSAQSGAGKTHVCTAIFKELILRGKKGKYMLWVDEIENIKQQKKTYDKKIHDDLIAELKEVEILYIDDFLKLYDNANKSDLRLAYEIINARTIKGLKTIISTELTKNEIANLDMAICGRITQNCNKTFWVEIENKTDRNYRLYGDEV